MVGSEYSMLALYAPLWVTHELMYNENVNNGTSVHKLN